MDMRRPRPESASGEGHDSVQHASEAGPSTERSTNVATISPPPEGSSSSVVPHQPSSLPSVPSQTHIQLQQTSSDPPSPLPPTPTPHQTDATNTNISTLTASGPPTIITIMHGSASAVRPPVPLEPPTSTTLSELNRSGGEAFGFLQTSYWDPQTINQNLNASLVRLENVLTESMDGLDRARNATAAHERIMMTAINGDQMLPGMLSSGSRAAVDAVYERIRERQGGSFTTVRMGPRGPEIMVVPPRFAQATGGGPNDDGVTLRGLRVMAHQALASSSRQNETHQNQANAEQLQVVLTNIGGRLVPLHGRQLPPPFVDADNETTPVLQHPPRDLHSPSATPPTVVRISTPTTAESSHRADSISPRPPYPPVQPATVLERTPSPAPPLAYPLPLPNIRHVFDPTGAGLSAPAVPAPNNSVTIASSRGVSPVTLAPRGEVRQASEYHQLLLDQQPRRVRRRLDDSGGSVEVVQYPPSSPPFSPRYDDPTNPRQRSPTPLSDVDIPTLRGWEVVYPSASPSYQPTGGFVPPGITDSALPTPRPFNRSLTRPTRRPWRREDSNGDEVVSDDDDAEERQRELRRSRLMSRSTTNVNDPYDALSQIARIDSENHAGLRRDESNDQEKHIDGLGDATMSGFPAGSAGNSRPGSRGSFRTADPNFTGFGEGETTLFPCPLPIHPSEMVSKPYRPAREWKTRFTPPPPLYGSLARARAAAHAKGSRRPARRYGDPVGR